MRLLVPIVALLASGNLLAQTQAPAADQRPEKEKKFAIKTPDMKLEPFAQLQGWAVYSSGRAAENDNTTGLDKAENRTNFFFRRARLGFRGQPYKDLSYTLSLYYDNAGHDSQASTRALTSPSVNSTTGTSVGGMATVGVWDSFLSWKISNSDMFHATFGYFRPQISRESLTAAFNVNSFEKAVSQNYVRQSVIGRGFGRGTGVNFGGLTENKRFNYNVGFFNKNTTGEKVGSNTLGETQGSASNSLVYVARAAYSFGDPEMAKYSTSYITNYFGKRKGLTLALNGSSQDRTPLYKDNKVIGGDILFNWGNFNLDGEFFYIYKKNLGSDNFSRARTGHLRMGYLFFLENDTIIEPAVMVAAFYGENGSDYTGRDTTYDIGVNWYLDQNRYKFYMHYVGQSGDGSNLENKPGANGYHYGDYAGAGVTLQI